MKTDMIVKTGIFVALTVLLSYIFAIHTTFIHITFGFLSTAIFGILYGPMAAGIMAAIACFIGMSLFGQGVFFPGFIVSEFLVGYVYGYFLHGRNVTFKQLLLPETIVTVCIHLILNTMWLTIFYNKAVSAIFIGRLIKNIICFPLEIALILIVYKAVSKFMVQKKPSSYSILKCTPNIRLYVRGAFLFVNIAFYASALSNTALIKDFVWS